VSDLDDGSRPFRAYWTDYNDESTWESGHTPRLKPIGDEYWENRQKVGKPLIRLSKGGRVVSHLVYEQFKL
jgi:hypothetical protein